MLRPPPSLDIQEPRISFAWKPQLPSPLVQLIVLCAVNPFHAPSASRGNSVWGHDAKAIVFGYTAVAAVWFFVNTGTLSLAVSLALEGPFFPFGERD